MSKRYVAWLVLALGAASCFPVLEEYGSQVPNEVQACQAADTCPDDKNQCTLNTCNDNKVCEYKPIAGIAPEQTVGDCQQGFCSNDGVFSEQPDDMDTPDDKESCTNDACMNGVPSHVARMDGESCTIGDAAGLCIAGKCTVECDAQKPCNDMNPCTQDTCNASTGKCSFSNLDGLPTPGVMEMVGDCKQHICVNGVDTSFDDNADLPNDDNTCTKDACVNGMPVNTVISASGPCIASGTPGVCNATGACIQCNVAEDCPAIVPANPCKQRTCMNNVCGTANLPAMDVASALGDCKKSSCDGNGNVVLANDNTDVPTDGNLCTADVCTNGTPSNPPAPNTAKCGPTLMLTCDGLGQCTGCTTSADCGMSDDCKTFSCVMSKCVISYVPSGMPLPKNRQTDADCQVLQCDGAGNTIGAIDPTDAPDDNNQCTQNLCDSMGIPMFPAEPLNTNCASGGGTVCNGLGGCVKAPGANCADGGECITGFCTDGVCCTDVCTAGCMACNLPGATGTCSNLPAGTDDGMFCSGTNSCDGMGACKRDNGTACTMASQCASGFCTDGVCCNTDCMETCKTCTRAGFVGMCFDLPNDQPDTTATTPCTGSNRCDGLGNCKLRNAYACTMASQCLSGYCADGYCCGSSCNQLCVGCSQALNGVANGSCQPIPNGADPQNECAGAATCNGAGMCTP